MRRIIISDTSAEGFGEGLPDWIKIKSVSNKKDLIYNFL